jgi:ribonuclease HI
VECDGDSDYDYFRLFFDGSCTKDASGGGWVLYGATPVDEDREDEWTKLAEMSFRLCQHSTVTVAELEACLWGVAYVSARLQGRATLAHHLEVWRPLQKDNYEILELSGLIQ